MNKTALRKYGALTLCLLLLVTALACGGNDSAEVIKGLQWENQYLRDQLDAANAELDVFRNATPAPSATPAPVVTPEPEIVEHEVEVIREVPGVYAFGVNCLLNGQKLLPLSGTVKVTAVPELPEGMIFEGWKVNGEDAGAEPELTLTLSETTLIEAVYHKEKTVTCINCYFQFTNNKDKASGDKLETFSFERPYVNPVTRAQMPGGTITGVVTANVPKNKTVDYWIINGVEYHYNNTVKYFRIVDLNEATTFEVVFKGAPKKTEPGPTRIPGQIYPDGRRG